MVLPGILFTPIDTAAHNSWNVAMRQQLDIYASLVICKSLPGYPTRHKDVDFAIIRENTEGEYSGLEHQVSLCECRLAPEQSLLRPAARRDQGQRRRRMELPCCAQAAFESQR